MLEESIISATLKHLSLVDTVRHLVSHEEHNTEEYRLLKEVMSELYRKINALIRQLQVRQDCTDDVCHHKAVEGKIRLRSKKLAFYKGVTGYGVSLYDIV